MDEMFQFLIRENKGLLKKIKKLRESNDKLCDDLYENHQLVIKLKKQLGLEDEENIF